MKRQVKSKMVLEPSASEPTPALLHLPGPALVAVLSQVDAASLAALEQTCIFFTRKEPATRLPLTEDVARKRVLARCGTLVLAERFRCNPRGAARHRQASPGRISSASKTSWCPPPPPACCPQHCRPADTAPSQAPVLEGAPAH